MWKMIIGGERGVENNKIRKWEWKKMKNMKKK